MAITLEAQFAEREQLRAEVDRLSKALVAAYTDVEVVTADRDRLRALSDADADFKKGYDQAVAEIRAYFAQAGEFGAAHAARVGSYAIA